MDTNVKRREWVKTAAIIFLAVLLVLTFFSNTIMNASLPEVATQQVTQGTINAKIRASGTITANETYNVKLAQSRKIESVKCKVGQAVNAGDVLFVLEAQESDELKAGEDRPRGAGAGLPEEPHRTPPTAFGAGKPRRAEAARRL